VKSACVGILSIIELHVLIISRLYSCINIFLGLAIRGERSIPGLFKAEDMLGRYKAMSAHHALNTYG